MRHRLEQRLNVQMTEADAEEGRDLCRLQIEQRQGGLSILAPSGQRLRRLASVASRSTVERKDKAPAARTRSSQSSGKINGGLSGTA